MRVRHRFLPLLLITACGDDGHQATPDAPGPDAPPSETQTVVLRARGTVLVAVKEGETPWRPIDRGANDDVTIEVVNGPFIVASVCDDPGYFNYYLNYAGAGTGEILLMCSEQQQLVTVTANAGAANVFVGFYPIVSGGATNVPVGTHDVVAVDDTTTPARFEIRRGVTISADTTLTFDLSQTGTAMRAVPFTHDAVAGETVGASTRLRLAGGGRPFARARNNQLWLFPAAALMPGDGQFASASAGMASPASRGAFEIVTGSETAIDFTFPSGLTAATLTLQQRAPRATWQSAGAWTDFYIYTFSPDYTKLWDALVHPQWVAAEGLASELTFVDPMELPGWNPTWNLSSLAGFEWYLGLSENVSATESRSATWMETLPGGAPRITPRERFLRPAKVPDR
jgi:hypothetical protein